MKIKVIFMALALALSVNVEAQSFFEKVGKAVERGVEKGVQRAAEKQAEKAVNKTVDKATSGSSSSSSSKTQQTKQTSQEQQTQQATAPSSSNNTSKHEYVDLGLPSGTKWATCNIGASSPEEAGSYFAWGETSTKSSYTEENHKMYGKEIDDISGKSAYDAATAIWGKEWRTPTKAEFEELMNTCHGRFVQQNGVWGVKFTSRANGKYIFLPITGYMHKTTLNNANEKGHYWTSTPRSGFAHFGARFRLTKEGGEVGWGTAFYGFCIRPVAK